MDWVINDELGLTVGQLIGWMAASAMVIGGVIPYVPQYMEIRRTQDAEGFSLHVCLALLIANSLRIFFWFSKRYELPLLIQSIVMIITMFLMIHLCVKVKRASFANGDVAAPAGASSNTKIRSETRATLSDNTYKPPRPKRYFCDCNPKEFWNWTDFQSYLEFMLIFWAVGAFVTFLMLSYVWFMEIVGFFAVFNEAMLGAPQFIRNYKNKSTYGMSIHMVIMWTLGDMFKTGYFIVRNAPMQFWICGTLQVSLDLAILLQVWIYRKNSKQRGMHRGD